MPLSSLPPLDLQTETVGPYQHPSTWLLVVIAVITMGGLFVSWAAHRDILAADIRLGPGTTRPTLHFAASPVSPASPVSIDQAVVVRIAARRR